MGYEKAMTNDELAVWELHQNGMSWADISRELGIPVTTVKDRGYRARDKAKVGAKFEEIGYDVDPDKKPTPQEAWDSHAPNFENYLADRLGKTWQCIKRPKGPVVFFHATDVHLDDNATPLKVLEQDIQASHDMNAIMCHGGDALNNWPMGGRLAQQWAEQECTAPAALLRLQHYIDIFKPDVWVDGNHEEMNYYLDKLVKEALPKDCIKDYWSVRFTVEAEGGRPIRTIMSHKFQKGGSWFHKLHGHIREMLEGESADLLMDGHLHSDGIMDHTLPERGVSALGVATAGYKMFDKYASRISKGGKSPKMRGRAHWIVADTQAEEDENFLTAFKSPRQAEAFVNGLQNLRTV